MQTWSNLPPKKEVVVDIAKLVSDIDKLLLVNLINLQDSQHCPHGAGETDWLQVGT